MIDVNTCTKGDLMRLGLNKTSAHSIVANRPYKAVSDLRTVPGVTKIAYRLLKSKVVCIAESEVVEVPKVNINTATAKELMEVAGMNETYAYSITGWRNKNGSFGSLEEVLGVKYIPKNFLERFGDKLTV